MFFNTSSSRLLSLFGLLGASLAAADTIPGENGWPTRYELTNADAKTLNFYKGDKTELLLKAYDGAHAIVDAFEREWPSFCTGNRTQDAEESTFEISSGTAGAQCTIFYWVTTGNVRATRVRMVSDGMVYARVEANDLHTLYMDGDETYVDMWKGSLVDSAIISAVGVVRGVFEDVRDLDIRGRTATTVVAFLRYNAAFISNKPATDKPKLILGGRDLVVQIAVPKGTKYFLEGALTIGESGEVTRVTEFGERDLHITVRGSGAVAVTIGSDISIGDIDVGLPVFSGSVRLGGLQLAMVSLLFSILSNQ